MAFQSTVNKALPLGVVGEYADDSPHRETGYILRKNSTIMPKVGCAFTYGSTDDQAVIGGTNAFAGVLVGPKEYANYKDLTANLELPDGVQGGLCTFGHVYVVSGTSFAPGYVAAFNTSTGAINAYEEVSDIPGSGYAQIPNAKFIKVSGSANALGILQLGD
jgi:hypothetical protein